MVAQANRLTFLASKDLGTEPCTRVISPALPVQVDFGIFDVCVLEACSNCENPWRIAVSGALLTVDKQYVPATLTRNIQVQTAKVKRVNVENVHDIGAGDTGRHLENAANAERRHQ